MRIYLASNNPGPRELESEKYDRLQFIPRRLISYWQIAEQEMDCHNLFEWCKNANSQTTGG